MGRISATPKFGGRRTFFGKFFFPRKISLSQRHPEGVVVELAGYSKGRASFIGGAEAEGAVCWVEAVEGIMQGGAGQSELIIREACGRCCFRKGSVRGDNQGHAVRKTGIGKSVQHCGDDPDSGGVWCGISCMVPSIDAHTSP